jgi:MFS family permease
MSRVPKTYLEILFLYVCLVTKEKDSASHDPFAALRIREFSFFIAARFFLTLGIQMQSVIVGWQVYNLTKSVLDLGYIGLAEALPFIAVSFFSGHIADIISRKRIILVATTALALSTVALSWFSSNASGVISHFGITPIFVMVGLSGIIRAFLGPAFPSFMTQLVPRVHYTNAATWNSSVWHTGFIAGNTLGGLLCYFGMPVAYGIEACIIFSSMAFVLFIGAKPLPPKEKKESLTESLSVGLKFVFNNKIVLGALSLDLFAVLFGGAVAMLPAFVHEVLHVGSFAQAMGAVATALILVYFPMQKNAGRNLLVAIAGFGLTTILFAVSRNFYLSFFMLVLTGAFDNVSVVVRHSILQLMTPDQMRGRVSAVNNIFIGSSNEIGAFESGLTARAMGLVTSVVFGGAMTLLIVFITARVAPAIRKLNLKSIE